MLKLSATVARISAICSCVRPRSRSSVAARVRRASSTWYSSRISLTIHRNIFIQFLTSSTERCMRFISRGRNSRVCLTPCYEIANYPPLSRQAALQPLAQMGCQRLRLVGLGVEQHHDAFGGRGAALAGKDALADAEGAAADGE